MSLNQDQLKHLQSLTLLIRSFTLKSTNQAGSGHPSSSLSAVELMTTLFFGGFQRFAKDRNGKQCRSQPITSSTT